MKNTGKKIKQAYKTFGIIFFNTLILLAIFNLLAWIYLKYSNFSDRKRDLVEHAINYNCFLDSALIIKTNRTYINEVINDFCVSMDQTGSEYKYYPVIEYCQKEFKSKHLNVICDENIPYRFTSTTRGGDSVIQIFCFGGSTTYGSFVSDEHTWPAFLMKNLNSKNHKFNCVNYGISGFTPSQETYQFIQLLKIGYRPSVSIFMDGVNTGPTYDGSEFSKNIAEKFEYDENGNNIGIRVLIQLPLTRLIFLLLNNNNLLHNDDIDIFPLEYSNKYNQLIINRFIKNAKIRQQIANLYGLKIIQFLQPNVFIDYNSELLSPLLKLKYHEDSLIGASLQTCASQSRY